MAVTFKITNGDVSLSATTGRPVMITGALKLSQDMKEVLSTSYADTGIGASIHELVGASDGANITIASLVEQRIYRSVNALKDIARNRPGLYAADERIATIDRVLVHQVVDNPHAYRFRVDVTTEAGADRAVSGEVG